MQTLFDVRRLFAGLRVLADTPVDPTEFAMAAERLGWEVRERDDAPEDEVVLEVATPFTWHRLVAVFSDRTMAGLPLYVLSEDEDSGSSFCLKSRSDFDRAFERMKLELEQASMPAVETGVYQSAFVVGALQYALWSGRGWHVALVQHDEGDANYGHGLTLDLRLLPHETDAAAPVFPLDTDLIF